MDKAQKIEFKNIKLDDWLIIKTNNYFIPVKVVERTTTTIYYKFFNFHKLEYVDEDQHATYKTEDGFGNKKRLFKKDHKDIFIIDKEEVDPELIEYIEHKAETLYYTKKFYA